jgi:hypothetical protein
MIARILRLRATLGLTPEKPLVFLGQANAVYTGLDNNKTLFVSPNPALPVLFQQIEDATKAHQNVGQLKGAVAIRSVKFKALVTSLESERMMVQALCDASPDQAAALMAAASMKAGSFGKHHKPILAVKNILPSGSVLLDANAILLDPTHRAKTYNWQMTMDGKTFSAMPSTPTGQTTIANLTPLTTVGFQVSVSIHKQPPGLWSQTVNILVR